MKEFFLTLLLAITTGATILIFTLTSSHQSLLVFDSADILFEHQTIHGNIIITSNTYDELSLSFLNRNIGGMMQAGSSLAQAQGNTSFMSLPANSDIPFTTHAVISSNPNLYEIIVVESGSRIAHKAHAKKTTCEDTAAFVVSSADLTGVDTFIVGLDADGTILVEIEIP